MKGEIFLFSCLLDRILPIRTSSLKSEKIRLYKLINTNCFDQIPLTILLILIFELGVVTSVFAISPSGGGKLENHPHWGRSRKTAPTGGGRANENWGEVTPTRRAGEVEGKIN